MLDGVAVTLTVYVPFGAVETESPPQPFNAMPAAAMATMAKTEKARGSDLRRNTQTTPARLSTPRDPDIADKGRSATLALVVVPTTRLAVADPPGSEGCTCWIDHACCMCRHARARQVHGATEGSICSQAESHDGVLPAMKCERGGVWCEGECRSQGSDCHRRGCGSIWIEVCVSTVRRGDAMCTHSESARCKCGGRTAHCGGAQERGPIVEGDVAAGCGTPSHACR